MQVDPFTRQKKQRLSSPAKLRKINWAAYSRTILYIKTKNRSCKRGDRTLHSLAAPDFGGKKPRIVIRQASPESNRHTHSSPKRRRSVLYLSDLREGAGDAGFTQAPPADPGSTGFRRHRPLPVPRPEAAAQWLRVCARSRMPSFCIRSMFSRILASLSRS
jgi:hypothetical protein